MTTAMTSKVDAEIDRIKEIVNDKCGDAAASITEHLLLDSPMMRAYRDAEEAKSQLRSLIGNAIKEETTTGRESDPDTAMPGGTIIQSHEVLSFPDEVSVSMSDFEGDEIFVNVEGRCGVETGDGYREAVHFYATLSAIQDGRMTYAVQIY